MYIAPINVNGTSQKPGFTGKLINKGFGWNSVLKNAFKNSNSLKSLTNGYDVAGRISKIEIGTLSENSNFVAKENLYKLKLSFRRENSVVDKVKDFFGLLPRYSLTENFHHEDGLIDCMDSSHIQRLEKKLQK